MAINSWHAWFRVLVITVITFGVWLKLFCRLVLHCPDCMKLAEITALYKSKDRELCTNYRPISLLITISKILEKIVYKRVYRFLNTTNQFYEKQYGFRSKHSCKNAVSDLVGEQVKNIQDKKYTISLFLDLSKAFDTLEHAVIFDKMEKYGI